MAFLYDQSIAYYVDIIPRALEVEVPVSAQWLSLPVCLSPLLMKPVMSGSNQIENRVKIRGRRRVLK